MKSTVASQFIRFLCIFLYLSHSSAYKCENNLRNKRYDYCSTFKYEQNITLCQTVNLNVTHFADSEQQSITISFSLNDTVKYKGCFPYFDIFLVNIADNTRNGCQLHAYEFEEEDYSHTFRSVPPGLYETTIQPCYTRDCCANLSIYQRDLINVTSYNLLSYSLEIPNDDNSNISYFAIAVPIGIILFSFGLYYFCLSDKLQPSNVSQTEKGEINFAHEKIIVYLFHYYDNKGTNKQKANSLKDYLIRSSLYDSVKTIEDQLPLILDNVHKWVDDVLQKSTQDGKIQKIILVDSKEEDEDGEIENLIFNAFVCKLNDNLTQCLTSYDNIFVVKVDGIFGSSSKLKNIVKRHRFHIPKHLVELCLNVLNVCSLPESHILSIKKHLQDTSIHDP